MEYKPIKQMSDEELMQIAQDCNFSVNISKCFVVSDIQNLLLATNALEQRGYICTGKKHITFKKISQKQAVKMMLINKMDGAVVGNLIG